MSVWSMDSSFDLSFAALSGSFDGQLHLWDVREDVPTKSTSLNMLVNQPTRDTRPTAAHVGHETGLRLILEGLEGLAFSGVRLTG